MIQQLSWKDLELLVDLIFSTTGWRRVSRVGATQKTIDLELVLPTTSEKAFVQVKSRAGVADVREYVQKFEDAPIYERMFFVWHTGDIPQTEATSGVTLVGPHKLAGMVIDSGLSSWLRDKVA
jgi:hypothetical protein